MSRKPPIARVLTHLLVAGAGLLLARQMTGASGGTTAGNGADSSSRKQGVDSRRPDKQTRTIQTWRGSEYARAWKALKTAKLTTKERLQTQRELLRAWAEVDLNSSLEAALAEAWDSDREGYYDLDGPLLDVFSEAFAKHPEDGWELITSRQYGLGTGLIRNVWIQAVGERDPLFLASRLGQLSWRDRDRALDACRMGMSIGGKDNAAKLIEVLAGLPAEVISAKQVAEFSDIPGMETDPARLREEIASTTTPRMAQIKAAMLGAALASSPVSEIEAGTRDLPEQARAEAVWAAFSNHMHKPADATALLDLLVADQAWDKFENSETVDILRYALKSSEGKAGGATIAQWAATMPVRKETTELFHRSVETYLRDNMQESRLWIATIEETTWRDRAYAEYSQQALNAHKDPEASRWALDKIQDQKFKAEAEGWRSSWEKRNAAPAP